MQVCVIGTGYVGLVTGVCLAHVGHDVVCVDKDETKVALMQSGQSPIYEPGLSELMKSSMQSGNLSFTSNLADGVAHGEILFIAVGTPALPSGESDTRYVEAVARGIGEHLNGGYKVIVNKSTVPVGSGDWVRRIVIDGVAERQELIAGFDVVSNPEFLREGSAIYDTFNPDRIVLGSHSDRAIALMQQLYEPIVNRQFAADPTLPPVPVVITDLASAEMIKYAANSFLATKISFINEIANICDRVGAGCHPGGDRHWSRFAHRQQVLAGGDRLGWFLFSQGCISAGAYCGRLWLRCLIAQGNRQHQPSAAVAGHRKTAAGAENPQG